MPPTSTDELDKILAK